MYCPTDATTLLPAGIMKFRCPKCKTEYDMKDVNNRRLELQQQRQEQIRKRIVDSMLKRMDLLKQKKKDPAELEKLNGQIVVWLTKYKEVFAGQK